MNKINAIIKYFVILLVVTSAFNQMIAAQSQSSLNNTQTELHIKNEVAKRGTGEKAKVVVKLSDGGTVKGYISQTSSDNFTVTNAKTKQEIVIAYRSVEKIKKPGMSSGMKLALGLGAAAVAVGVVVAVGVSGLKDDILR